MLCFFEAVPHDENSPPPGKVTLDVWNTALLRIMATRIHERDHVDLLTSSKHWPNDAVEGL